MTDDATTGALLAAAQRVHDAAVQVRLPLELPDVEEARHGRQSLVQQLDDYVLPRLRSIDAPLLCVVGGSTGAGKSTLVNSVVGEVVSRTGVLRPTTRASVLVHHPGDARWFSDGRVLPELARLTGEQTEHDDPGAVRLVGSDSLPAGLALLDAPDIDSVVRANRDLARQLLAAADLWLFVTTAARYADAVPWDLLRGAAERGTSVAIVLDRVPPEAMEEVRVHLAGMLADQGLGQAPVFTVPETPLEQTGMLPHRASAKLNGWLHSLAGDQRARSTVIRRTLDGALGSLEERADQLHRAASAQAAAREVLDREARAAYRIAVDAVEQGMEDGSLLRGEVLARWQELVGTGEFLRQVEAGIGRARDRVTNFFTGRQASPEPLGAALQSGAAALITSQAQIAASSAARAWRAAPGGAALVSEHPELATESADLGGRVEMLIRDWQAELLQMVRTEAGGRRSTARYLAFGVNGLAVMLMLISFSLTGGALVVPEVAIAGGSAVLAQRLLEAVFGDQAVREMARHAREGLLSGVAELYDVERERFTSVLATVAVEPEAVAEVRRAADDVAAAR